MKANSIYSLRRSRSVLRRNIALYRKKKRKLTDEARSEMEDLIISLQEAIDNQERENANILAQEIESYSRLKFKKGVVDYLKEIAIALMLALIIAIPVRQMWFELYEIPTGSMRPTFKEGDKLTVTKTTFGINTPITAGHFYFNPDLVERTGVVILAGDGLDLSDTESNYFGFIPSSKRYIKRLIAKPGDTVYFYGGKIFAIDKEGAPIRELLEASSMQNLEHVPFLAFEGRQESQDGNKRLLIKHMNQYVAQIKLGNGKLTGELFVDGNWVKDFPNQAIADHDQIVTYSDFYGMGNFGMARLLTKKELNDRVDLPKDEYCNAELYLEISHHPSVAHPLPGASITGGGLAVFKSVIPLNQKHLNRLMENMYTARFVVYDNFARRYSIDSHAFSSLNPRFVGVQNGTYEFYNGQGYSIGIGKIESKLPKNHPLNRKTPGNIQKLYNHGINFDRTTSSSPQRGDLMPSRYVYFRDGDLYAMGKPLLKKDDAILTAFVEQEMQRVKREKGRYLPFIDVGPPVNQDGTFDVEKIQAFGFSVPEGHYLVLGDNHAMSVDSRVFGVVPEQNLRGTPSIILWPPGERFGLPSQKQHSLIVTPRIIVWFVAATITLLFYYFRNRPYRFEREKKEKKR